MSAFTDQNGGCWVSSVGQTGVLVSCPLGLCGSLAIVGYLLSPNKRADLQLNKLSLTSFIFIIALSDAGACVLEIIADAMMVRHPEWFLTTGQPTTCSVSNRARVPADCMVSENTISVLVIFCYASSIAWNLCFAFRSVAIDCRSQLCLCTQAVSVVRVVVRRSAEALALSHVLLDHRHRNDSCCSLRGRLLTRPSATRNGLRCFVRSLVCFRC